ncbi:MAG: hypothetical protein LCH54_05815 [Bacteroidetes bacterium]|nr:hypothetical protein [Bacteroidota bacterium]
MQPETLKKELYDNLVIEVRTLIGNPINVYAVAATLESLGVRDMDAVADYGFADVFKLADQVHEDIRLLIIEETEKNGKKKKDFFKVTALTEFKYFFKYYSQGILFAMPMAIQILSVIFLTYSLWAWLRFNEAQATIVALGTITAFVVTGGFTQLMGRLASYYNGSGNYLLAYKAAKNTIRNGVVTTLSVALIFFIVNLVIPFYPQTMMFLSMTYMILLSLLIQSSAVLYATEQRLMISVSIAIGTAFVIAGMEVFNLGIYLSHWLGLSVSIIIMFGYGWTYYRFKIKNMRKDFSLSRMPKTEVVFFNTYRFFAYGTLYFFFLFLDRILAWSAGPPPPPYIIWFNTPYELGMDWALITLLLTIAVLEYSIHSFSKIIIPVQQATSFDQVDEFNKFFKRFYYRQALILLIIGIVSMVLVYFAVMSLEQFKDRIPELRDFFDNPVTIRVYWLASIGYILLCFGLLHALFFFTLNRAAFAMNAMIIGVIVNFVVGYICSRTISYEYAVLGLIAGSAVFAFLTWKWVHRFFSKLDYFYYTAY